MAPIADKTVY